MVTQLRQTGLLARASAVVIGELPRCDEPSGRADRRARSIADLFADFPGPVLIGFPSGHTTGPAMTLPFGVDCRVVGRRAAAARHRGGGRCHETRVHLIGICGTAMATLAAMLKQKGFDVRGSDQDVYPPMSDFLAAEGIHDVQRLRRRAHHRRSRPRRRRQRDLARQPRARRGARPEDPLLLAAGSDPRALSVGRALDRHRRHARQDDDDVADRLAADPRRRRPERARRRHRAELRRGRVELPHRAGPRLRDRGRRVRQRVLRQDRQVPEVPARHRRRQQRRVRSRGHLRRPRRRARWRSAASSTWCRAAACCCSAPTARCALALDRRAPCRGSRPSAPATAWTGRRTTSSRTASVDAISRPARAGRRSARSRCRSSARTTSATRWRRSPWRREVGIERRADRRGPAALCRRQAAARGRRDAPTA